MKEGTKCFYKYSLCHLQKRDLFLFHYIKYDSEQPYLWIKKCLYVFKKAVANKWLNETMEVGWDIKQHRAEHLLISPSLQEDLICKLF